MTFTENQLSDDANAIFDDIESKLSKLPEGVSYFEGSVEDAKKLADDWIKNIPQGVIGAW